MNGEWHKKRRAAVEADAASKPQATQAKRRRNPERWATFNGFVDVTAKELTPAELLCWLVLYRDVRNGVARTGMTDIARRAGLTRRGVVKAIGGLKEKRLVEVVTRGSKDGSTNVYRVAGLMPT